MFQKQPSEDLVEYQARMYGACLACGQASTGHLVWELAAARPHDPESQFTALENAIADRDWSRASQVQEFRGAESAIVFLLLKCPTTERVTLLRLESFAELWSDDRVVNRTLLTASEAESVMLLVQAQWRRVGEPTSKPGV